ncbi:MAG TPA: hypothetical protein VF576_09130, partial [Rubricoccaceae bacterium]
MYRLLLASLVAFIAPAAAQVELAPLYPSPGAYAFNLVDMSNDGRVLVGYEIGPDGWYRSVRWEDGVLTVLPDLRDGAEAHYNLAGAVSADGRVVYGYWGTGWDTPGQRETPYRWTEDTLVVAPDQWLVDIAGASADGSVAVGRGRPFSNRNGDQPFRWQPEGGGIEYLNAGTVTMGFAHGASADGSQVAWHTSSFPSSPLVPFQAYRWQSGASTPLSGVKGYGAEGNTGFTYFHTPISDDGRTIYGEYLTGEVIEDDGPDAYVLGLRRWRDGAVTMLPFPPGGPSLDLHRCHPTAASADGRVVAGMCYGNAGNHYSPVIWREGEPPRFLPDDLAETFGIDPAGWTFGCASPDWPACAVRALSGDGTAMTGVARYNGTFVVFRVGPPPAALTVSETGDEPDANLADGVCDVDPDSPGRQCTLRAALQTANEEPGADRITFDLSEARGGVATITLEGPLPVATEPVEIDASPPAPR